MSMTFPDRLDQSHAMVEVTFRCNRCEIWTGSVTASIENALSSSDINLHTVYGGVTVKFIRESARRSVAIATSTRSILILDETVRSIGVYCPSPFIMAVVVQVDVDEVSQVCFALSQINLGDSQQSDTQATASMLCIHDRVDAINLLSQLHSHLQSVPLTAEARDVITKHKIEQSTSVGKRAGRSIPRQRRSVNPQVFYGGKSTDILPQVPTHTSPEDQSWSTFYQRLQFNVSHSLLCQLEGTAPLSATFPRQQEAFEFADQVAAFRQRLQTQQRIDDASESERNEPRVFCYEGANEGKRQFWVTTLDAFWKEYTAIPLGARHVYEIIREGTPCRLYFDLEFKAALNTQVNGDALVDRMISLLQLQIYREFHLLIQRDLHVVELDSSTPDKFSRHLTIHFPNGELFMNNLHAGAFVRQFIRDLVIPHTEQDESQFLVRDSVYDATKQLFIDVGVYTRNRMFRVLGSSKFRKTAVLRRIGGDPSEPLDHELFMRSIVCPGTRYSSNLPGLRLLRCEDNVSLKRHGVQSHSISYQPMRSVESKSSIYPALDAFIRSIATTGGVQGEIRAVTVLYPTRTCVDATDQHALVTEPVRIVYHMRKNRWCENIGRPHKSNNVMFVVDLQTRSFRQRCHDPHCNAIDYWSPSRPLPTHLELVSREQ